MNLDYKFHKWKTLITDKDLLLIELKDKFENDEEYFSLVFKDATDNSKYRVEFKHGVEGYRNIDEGAHMEMWSQRERQKFEMVNTFIVSGTAWEKESMHYFEGLKHYVITTDDDVVEILSSTEPKITKIS